MIYNTILPVEILANNLDSPNWRIVDCRYSLADRNAGQQAYQVAHVPGAVYADLERDLSGSILPGVTGRHPLPEIDKAREVFSKWGIDQNIQVVCYDDTSGAYAARLWWMLHWLGHEAVAVLDGGWQAWQSAGYPEQQTQPTVDLRNFQPVEKPSAWVTSREVEIILADPSYKIVDAREHGRYLGEYEPIDVKSGRIPGALSVPYLDNLQDGKFKSPEVLRTLYEAQIEDTSAERVIVYCGSGVTAAHDILAMKVAGLGYAKLYAGSFSEWITQDSRPVIRGKAR